MKKNIFLFLYLTMLLLSGCNNTPEINTQSQTLTIVAPIFPENIFPASTNHIEQSHIISQIHDGLLAWDIEKEAPVGRLVKRWVENNNHDEITFHLHDQIFFHDDPCFANNEERVLKSDDVKYSLEYTFWHKAVNNKGIGLLKYILGGKEYYQSCDNMAFVPNKLSGIKIIDSLTFKITLKEPNPSFIKSLIASDLVILPIEGIKKYGDECTIGCGPFLLTKKDIQNKTYELHKNPKYYLTNKDGKKLPYLDKVIFLFEATPAKSLRMMRDQKADLLLSMEQKHIKAFVEDNIELFEKKYPDLVLEQAKGLENTSVYLIRRGSVKELNYSSMNILDLSTVNIESNVEIKQ
jgi:oligopeptide transport system substrate-binding protein